MSVACAQTSVPESAQQIQLSFAPVVRIAAPAVVNIYSRRVVRAGPSPFLDDPFFRRFFGENFSLGLPRQRVENSLGSGVIVAADGTIVTNHHVVAGADEITTVLADRREFAARLVGSDERTDIAVLKVDTGRRTACHSSNSAIPTPSRWVIWCWRLAIRSASAKQ